MDAAAHYRHLIGLGRDEFLAAAAPAALVRYQRPYTGRDPVGVGASSDDTVEKSKDQPIPTRRSISGPELALYPLVRRPEAPFSDRITIGRTPQSDIVIEDHSVSRQHAYVRQDGATWLVADAGSKNGSWLRGAALEPRREKVLPSRAVLRFGDVDVTFFLANDLFAALGGT